MSIPRPEHPNPQFERKDWVNLNGKWFFEEDTGSSGIERKFYERETLSSEIIVPFCPESELSGIGKVDFMNCVWYLKKFKVPKKYSSKRAILHFGAVDYEAFIYVNGQLVKRHVGGFVSFEVDITKFLKDGENKIVVCAKDNTKPHFARGKQSEKYYSEGCAYTRTTGIWQTVWIEYVPEKYVKSVKYYPSVEQKSLLVDIEVSQKGKLKLEATYKGKNVGEVSVNLSSTHAKIALPLSEMHLWEVGKGRLYDLTITFEKDEIKSYFGMRTTEFADKKYLLNGKETFLVTVLDQGYYKKGIYTAPTDKDLENDIDLSLNAGFNGARLHQKVFEPRFLYHCDKKGYLVFGETGNWGVDWSDMSLLPEFLNEWKDEIQRDFNHPAIIGWCPLNETWDIDGRHQDDDFVRIMYETTKALDTTRPCIGTSGNYQVASDIYDLHDYIQTKDEFEKIYLADSYEKFCEEYDKAHEWVSKYQKSIDWKDYPLFISEYGGIQWDVDQVGGWGYGNGPKTEEEYFERYEYLTKTLFNSPYVCGVCFTQLYDIEQEVNGIYTYERKPKFDVNRIKEINKSRK